MFACEQFQPWETLGQYRKPHTAEPKYPHKHACTSITYHPATSAVTISFQFPNNPPSLFTITYKLQPFQHPLPPVNLKTSDFIFPSHLVPGGYLRWSIFPPYHHSSCNAVPCSLQPSTADTRIFCFFGLFPCSTSQWKKSCFLQERKIPALLLMWTKYINSHCRHTLKALRSCSCFPTEWICRYRPANHLPRIKRCPKFLPFWWSTGENMGRDGQQRKFHLHLFTDGSQGCGWNLV